MRRPFSRSRSREPRRGTSSRSRFATAKWTTPGGSTARWRDCYPAGLADSHRPDVRSTLPGRPLAADAGPPRTRHDDTAHRDVGHHEGCRRHLSERSPGAWRARTLHDSNAPLRRSLLTRAPAGRAGPRDLGRSRTGGTKPIARRRGPHARARSHSAPCSTQTPRGPSFRAAVPRPSGHNRSA
jgi:hypothetical protein